MHASKPVKGRSWTCLFPLQIFALFLQHLNALPQEPPPPQENPVAAGPRLVVGPTQTTMIQPQDPPPADPTDPVVDDPFLGVPRGLRSMLNAAAIPSPTPGCQINECVVIYPVCQRLSAHSPLLMQWQSAEVFYWPDASSANTACLSTIKNQPAPTPHPDFHP